MTAPLPRPVPPQPAGAAMLIKPLLTLLALLAIGLGLRAWLTHAGGLTALRSTDLPWWGFLILGSAICAVGLPRQAVCFAAAFAYGAVSGLMLAFAANLIACLVTYGVARLFARRWVQRRLGGRWRQRIGALQARPFAAVLTLRLLPIGSSLLINLLAGAAELGLIPFAAATALGSLPQTVIFTLLGAGTRIGHAGQIALAIALFALSGACGMWLLRGRGRFVAETGQQD